MDFPDFSKGQWNSVPSKHSKDSRVDEANLQHTHFPIDRKCLNEAKARKRTKRDNTWMTSHHLTSGVPIHETHENFTTTYPN